jgi:hypothetical protein
LQSFTTPEKAEDGDVVQKRKSISREKQEVFTRSREGGFAEINLQSIKEVDASP